MLHIILWVLLAAAGCGKKNATNLPPLRVTLSASDAQPMGGKVFYTLVHTLFDEYMIEANALPFNEWYRAYFNHYSAGNNDAYFLMAPAVQLKEQEAEAMERFVRNGNTLFVATNEVNEIFRQNLFLQPEISDSVFNENALGLADTKVLADTQAFSYYFSPLRMKMDTVHTLIHRVLAWNEKNEPTTIQLKLGKGNLIMVTNAETLSNYFLLSGNNSAYARHLLSYVNELPDQVYWDEFYHRNPYRNMNNASVLDVILSIPALRWAFWLLVFLLGTAMLTHIVRRQRMVPIKVPNHNTTVEFTETIARLYFNQKDNRNIALKMIQHFLEHIRNRHYLPSQALNSDFSKILAGKTGAPPETTAALVEKMAAIQQGAQVSDLQLLWLNKQMTEVLHWKEPLPS